MNDVEPLPEALASEYPDFQAGDLLVSLRDLNLVLVFDPETLEVRWSATGPFVRQHDPDFIGGGWIGVFDNRRDGTERGTVLGGSRIIALHTESDSSRVVYSGSKGSRFYTAELGKWQSLENGNVLLIESQAGRVLEVDDSGNVVWEWVNEPFSDEFVPEVPEATRYPLSARDVAAWRCSTVSAHYREK